jgi:hypothetical protein
VLVGGDKAWPEARFNQEKTTSKSFQPNLVNKKLFFFNMLPS